MAERRDQYVYMPSNDRRVNDQLPLLMEGLGDDGTSEFEDELGSFSGGSKVDDDSLKKEKHLSSLPQMATLQRVLKETRYTGDFKILVVGRTGRGKSTLINSIIELGEEVMKEGAGGGAVTEQVKVHSYKGDDSTITVIDSPGLQDSQQSNLSYDHLVNQLKANGDNINIILYCMKMGDKRFDNDEILALGKLYQTFGPQFWERVSVVLTFANEENCEIHDSRDQDDIRKEPPLDDEKGWNELIKNRFTNRVQIRREELKDVLKTDIRIPTRILDGICFIPAGSYKVSRSCRTPFRLPDRENWLYELMKLACTQREILNLSKLSLRDSIHLAVIIDNEGNTSQEESANTDKKKESGDKKGEKQSNKEEECAIDNSIKFNGQAHQFRLILEQLQFHVLSFNSLSSQSIAHLLEVVTSAVDPSDVSALVVIILCKDKACTEFELDAVLPSVSRQFGKVPKVFFSNYTRPKKDPSPPEVIPDTSIILTVSSTSAYEPNYLPVVRSFSKLSKEVFVRPLKVCFDDLNIDLLGQSGRDCTYLYAIGENYILPAPYEPFNEKKKLDFLKKKLDIQRAIWHHIRSKTIDVLLQNKDEIRTLLRNERIARISTAVTGIVLGGGLVVGGIIAAPFTFGASIGLAVAGGAVGAAAGLGGVGALITRRVMSNSRLKTAQEHISLDQQLSKNINKIATEYSQELERYSTMEVAANFGSGFKVVASVGGRIGMATAVAVEGVVETSALALRTTGRVAGMALAGVSLAVTVPIDLAFIAYHSYRIHQARGDESGAKESDAFVKWFIQQIDTLLKDTFSIDQKTFEIQGNLAEFYKTNTGLYLQTPPEQINGQYTITVRTLFSGPFILPPGATLVSAVYDVSISKGRLEQAVSIEMDHCVDTTDPSFMWEMKFALGEVRLDRKEFVFKLLDKEGDMHDTTANIGITESCLLCIVYTGPVRKANPIKYAALCSYTSEYHNSFNMTMLFTKHLTSHFKYVMRECVGKFEPHPFIMEHSTTSTGSYEIDLEELRSGISKDGWIIAPNVLPENNKISKKQLDTTEVQPYFWSSPSVTTLPSIILNVQVYDERTATDELRHIIHVKGTNLRIPITATK